MGLLKVCGGVHRGQHRLALGTGSPCVLTPAGIAAQPRDATAAGKVMGLPGGAAAPSSGVTVTVTVVKPRGRLGLYGLPVWWLVRLQRPP